MMRKKTTFGFALTCVLVAAAIAFTGGYLIAGSKVKDVTDSTTATGGAQPALVGEVEEIIAKNYSGKPDQNELIRGMCRGYVEGLGDSAVQYMTAEEYATYKKEAEGQTVIYRNFGKGVGYLQFLGFTSSTKQSFTDALLDFSKSTTSKVSMLVLDLRNCSGGNMDVVVELLDLMLPEGEILAGIDKEGKRTVLGTSDQSQLEYGISVLVNDKTSGPAEMLAAQLAAYNKATVVGTTTAGSCARTDEIKLSNGDYILIPNLYYVTKGQQTYSGAGVVPSVVVEFSAAEQKSYESSTLDIAQDPQFIAAVKSLGVNDIATVSSDTDTDRKSSDSDTDKSSDSDKDSSSDSDSSTSSSSSATTSSGDLDEYWDDDEYWNNSSSDEYSGDNGDYDDNYDYNDDDGYQNDDYYGDEW